MLSDQVNFLMKWFISAFKNSQICTQKRPPLPEMLHLCCISVFHKTRQTKHLMKWQNSERFRNNKTFCNTHITQRSLSSSMDLCPFYSRLPLYGPFSLYGPLPTLCHSGTSTASVSSTALCLLNGPMALCSLYSPLSFLWPSVPSAASLCPLYSPLSPLRPSVPSATLFLLCGPLSPLRPSVSSAALCSLWDLVPAGILCPSWILCPLWDSLPPCDPLSTLWPSVLSMAFCPLYGPLSPLWPSVPSAVFCSLCSPLSPPREMFFSLFRKMVMLFHCFTKHILPKLPILPFSFPFLSFTLNSPLFPFYLFIFFPLNVPCWYSPPFRGGMFHI
jgi:hypothetical protein